jgi:hypothetical protein
MVDQYFSTLVMKGTLFGSAIIRYVQICEMPLINLPFVMIKWKYSLQYR